MLFGKVYQELGSKMVRQAGSTEVVAAGLDGHAAAQRAEADLALEVLQRAEVCSGVP